MNTVGTRPLSKFSKRDHQYGIQRIMYLVDEKEYKNDTLFMAIHIFDKYLMVKGHWNFPVRKVVTLFTISTLIAAKMEQPISPSFEKMLSLLNKKERGMVTR